MVSILLSSIVIVLYIASVDVELSQATKSLYIAPYVNKTHPCDTHGPGCQSELSNILVRYIVDVEDDSPVQPDEIVLTPHATVLPGNLFNIWNVPPATDGHAYVISVTSFNHVFPVEPSPVVCGENVGVIFQDHVAELVEDCQLVASVDLLDTTAGCVTYGRYGVSTRIWELTR